MIKLIKIDNFKSIQKARLELSNFNLLCGTNSSGKSTLLHALLILAQNSKLSINDHAEMNGELLQIGDFSDLKNHSKSNRENIMISGEYERGEKFKFEVKSDLDDLASSEIMKISQTENISKIEFEKKIFYLSSNRVGDIELHERGSNNQFGLSGQFAFNYLSVNSMRIITNANRNSFQSSSTLLNETNYWLKKVIGAELRVENLPNTSKLVTTYKSEGSNVFVRSINIGTGVSYVISIIILCLGVISEKYEKSCEKPIIIIENPEIHLHPKAQSNITEFLLFISKFAQVIIETQSDHVFNGYRVHVRKNQGKDINGKVYFAEYHNGHTLFEEIIIDKRGTIINEREDLFDQFNVDLMRLLT